jgi:hypothetical protein
MNHHSNNVEEGATISLEHGQLRNAIFWIEIQCPFVQIHAPNSKEIQTAAKY